MIRKISHYMLLLCLLIIIVLPALILSFDENIDPFAFSTAGLAQTYSQEGRFILFPYEVKDQITRQMHANELSIRLVPTLLLVMLKQITGITLWQLLFMPIIGLLFSLLVYVLGKNMTQSSLVATLYTITMSYTFFPVNIFYISVGLCLFLLFLITWLKFIEFDQMKGTYVFLLLVIFIAIFFSYYTAEFLVLMLLSGSLIVSLSSKKIIGIKTKMRLRTLLLSFLIIFMYFDVAFYYYLQIASPEKGLGSFSSYFNYVLRFLQIGKNAVTEFRPHIGNPIIVYIDLLQRMLIMLSLGIYVLYFIRNFRKENVELSYKGMAFSSLFLVGFSQIFLYSTVGYGLHTWSLFLVASLAALFSLNTLRIEMKKRKKRMSAVIFIIMMLVITSTSVVAFHLRIEDPLNPKGFRLHNLMKATVSWSVLQITEGYLATDSRTAGQLFMEAAKEEKTDVIYPYRIGIEVLYLYSFNEEVPHKFFRKDGDYLILSYDLKTRSFLAGEAWTYSPPLGEAFSFLNNYTSLNRIYDDGQGLVYNYRR